VLRGWQELLSYFEWKLFVTLTFRGNANGKEPAPEAAEKAVRAWLSEIHEELYGLRRSPSPSLTEVFGIRYAIAIERGRDGRLHCHLLLAGGDRVGRARWEPWSRRWFDRHGYCRIERPRSQADVAGYCAKYIMKGGDVELRSTWEDRAEYQRSLEAPLFDGPRHVGTEIVQSSDLLHAESADRLRRAARFVIDQEIASGSTGPERDAGACAPVDSGWLFSVPPPDCTGASPSHPGAEHASASKTGAVSSVRSRLQRRSARYQTMMLSRSNHIAVGRSSAAIAR